MYIYASLSLYATKDCNAYSDRISLWLLNNSKLCILYVIINSYAIEVRCMVGLVE